jgi:predicted RNA binding protein YcfA (HicA-like mRNA interferase family)
VKAVSGKRLCRLLKDNGWKLMRINGSHHVYSKKEITVRLSVPVHSNKPLKIGLQRHLMKMAGIDDTEL